MNIKNLFQNIRNFFKPQKEEELQDEVIVKFLRILEDVRAEEMSCDEMFNRLDEFVETEVESHDAENSCPSSANTSTCVPNARRNTKHCWMCSKTHK